MNYKFTFLLLLVLCLSKKGIGQTFNWEFVPVLEGENVQGVSKAEDGSATLVGYGNTILRSTDDGTTWVDPGIITNKDNLDYQAVSISGDVGYALAMTSFKIIDREVNDLYAECPLLKTVDGGETWTLWETTSIGEGSEDALNYSLPGNYVKKFMAVECIDDNVAYVAAMWKDYAAGDTHANVYKTTDGGVSWSVLLPDLGSSYITSIFEFNGHVYIAGNKTLYKVNIETDVVTDLYPVVDKDEDDAMYFWYPTVYNNTELIFPTTLDSIWVTSDEGASFHALPNVKKGYIAYKHNANTYVIGAGKDDTKATTDGGTTWVSCGVGESLWNGDVIGDSLVGLAKNAIYKMALSDIETGNFTWSKTEVPNGNGNIKGIESTDTKIFLAGMGDVLLASTDGAQTFSEVTMPLKKEIIYASTDIEFKGLAHGADGAGIITSRRHKVIDNPTGTDDVYMPGFIFTTSTNWTDFTVVDDTQIGAKYPDDVSSNPNAVGCWGQDYYVAECIDATTFYVFAQWYENVTVPEEKTTHSRIFKTTDACVSWDVITDDLGSAFITSIVFDGEMGYVGGNNILLKTTDGGENFTDLYSKLEELADASIYIQHINWVDASTIFVSTTSDGLFVSYDAGDSFSKIVGIAGCSGSFVIDSNSWMTVGTSSKTYYTNDAGSNWSNCYPGTTIYSPGEILGDYLFACAKSGLYKLAIADLDAGTGTAISQDLLQQNDIKVVRMSTELQLVSEDIIENCMLINMSGRVVDNYMVNSNQTAINTSSLPGGIYILRVSVEGQVKTIKVQL